MTPIRVQRKRTKGFNLQEVAQNGLLTVYVGRGTEWGNPFRVVEYNKEWMVKCDDCERQTEILTSNCHAFYKNKIDAVRDAIRCYELLIIPYSHQLGSLEDWYITESNIKHIKGNLKGKNLACFCPLADEEGNPYPCHADLLLKIANS